MNNIAKVMMMRNNTRDDHREEDMPESRRRRDSRGRYMEGDTEMRRYMEDGPEMRRRRDSRYAEDNPEMRGAYDGDMPESRFRDRRGREHYDDGRFAPMRNDGRVEWEDYPQGLYPRIPPYMPRQEDMPAENRREDYSPEERRANIRALPPANLIGFMGRDERRMQHGEHHRQEQRTGQSSGTRSFGQEMAQEWVKGMKNSDGSSGAHWTLDQAKNLMAQSGVTGIQPVEFWAVLNSIRSDYYRVAKKYGVDRPEFYSDLAKSWLDDKDAVEDKAAAYFEYVVKH